MSEDEVPGSNIAVKFSHRLSGKIVVITGVSPNSIGQTLSINIAKQQPKLLILASRTASKLDAVVSEIKKEAPEASVETVIMDLSSQASVTKATATIAKLVDRIDMLINNAAVVDSELRYTAEGIEMQFGVGHIGHFLFTNQLMPLLEASAKASENGATRIINVSSEGHRLGPVRFSDYNFEGKLVPEDEQSPRKEARLKEGQQYSVWLAYGQVKSANILFSVGLNKRLGDKGIRSYAVHPGAIQTDLSRSLSPEDKQLIESIVDGKWISLDQGTSTILIAALDPALCEPQESVYLSKGRIADAASYTHDSEIAERLWKLSEELPLRVGKCLSLPTQTRLDDGSGGRIEL